MATDSRIIVRREDDGFSLDYVGEDPDTRYLPAQRSFLHRMVDRILIGLRGPDRMRDLDG